MSCRLAACEGSRGRDACTTFLTSSRSARLSAISSSRAFSRTAESLSASSAKDFFTRDSSEELSDSALAALAVSDKSKIVVIRATRVSITELTFHEFDEPVGRMLQPVHFPLHHLQERQAFHLAERAGGGDREDGLGD